MKVRFNSSFMKIKVVHEILELGSFQLKDITAYLKLHFISSEMTKSLVKSSNKRVKGGIFKSSIGPVYYKIIWSQDYKYI